MSYTPPFHKKLFHQTRRLLAQQWLKRQKALQIGITGSQGKTNTTSIITTMLSTLGKTVVTDTNLDTTYNVPITALKVRSNVKFLVWELGIDHPGEMASHLQIAKPQIGIITGISPVHTDQEHMGSLETLIAEKRKLIEALPENGYAILNWDDEHVRGMAPYTKAHVLWYGTDKDNCNAWVDMKAETTISTLQGLECVIHSTDEDCHVKTPLIGLHHAYNLMAAFLLFSIITQDQGMPTLKGGPSLAASDSEPDHTFKPRAGQASYSEVQTRKVRTHTLDNFPTITQNFFPLPGRMSVDIGPLETTILNDSLRANPTSTRFGLSTLSQIKHAGKKIAVLAEMGELEKPEEEHSKLGEFIAKLSLDHVVVIGPLHKHTAQSAKGQGFSNIYAVEDVFEAAQKLKEFVKKGDLIYLKGSLLRHVERVLLILNGTKVSCKRIICPFYRSCGNCELLSK